ETRFRTLCCRGEQGNTLRRDAPTGKPAWCLFTHSFMNLDSGETGNTTRPSSLPCLPSPNSIARGLLGRLN
uniref:Uncharacterized protein n=1 Tax=Sus scrofa TaxID=9823 RepID=A0A4X1TEF0_PIG